MVGLPDGEKTLEDMYNRLDSIPACDGHIDGQTNGQTSCHSIVRAMHTRRAVKNGSTFQHRWQSSHVHGQIDRPPTAIADQGPDSQKFLRFS